MFCFGFNVLYITIITLSSFSRLKQRYLCVVHVQINTRRSIYSNYNPRLLRRCTLARQLHLIPGGVKWTEASGNQPLRDRS